MKIPLYLSKRFTQEQALRAVKEAVDGERGLETSACRALEEKLCEITGAACAVTAASAEDALENLFAAWSVGGKDAVFVPSFINPYILFAIIQCGATPIFVDCDSETWSISAEKLESAVKKCIKKGELYPRAVVAEDVFGMPFDADGVNDICSRYGLLLIENARTAQGAKYNGKSAGALGDAAVFSFKPPFGISAFSDGGAILTNDLRLDKNLRPAKPCAMETVRRVGYAPMDGITARLIAPQLESIEENVSKRNRNAEYFAQAVRETSLKTLKAAKNSVCAYPVFPLCAESQSAAAEMVNAFREADIECGGMFSKPLCRQPAFKRFGVQASEMPVGSMLSTCIFVLPCHEGLTQEQTEYICDRIKKICI